MVQLNARFGFKWITESECMSLLEFNVFDALCTESAYYCLLNCDSPLQPDLPTFICEEEHRFFHKFAHSKETILTTSANVYCQNTICPKTLRFRCSLLGIHALTHIFEVRRAEWTLLDFSLVKLRGLEALKRMNSTTFFSPIRECKWEFTKDNANGLDLLLQKSKHIECLHLSLSSSDIKVDMTRPFCLQTLLLTDNVLGNVLYDWILACDIQCIIIRNQYVSFDMLDAVFASTAVTVQVENVSELSTLQTNQWMRHDCNLITLKLHGARFQGFLLSEKSTQLWFLNWVNEMKNKLENLDLKYVFPPSHVHQPTLNKIIGTICSIVSLKTLCIADPLMQWIDFVPVSVLNSFDGSIKYDLFGNPDALYKLAELKSRHITLHIDPECRNI